MEIFHAAAHFLQMIAGRFIFGRNALHTGLGMLHGSLPSCGLLSCFRCRNRQTINGISHLLDNINDGIDVQRDFFIFGYDMVQYFGGVGFFIDSRVDFHRNIKQVLCLTLSKCFYEFLQRA